MSVHMIPTVKVHHAWDQIRFVALQTDHVDIEPQVYLNALLVDLLCGKKHVLVRVTNQKELVAMVIMSLQVDKLTGNKSLVISNLYAWEKQTDGGWKEMYEQLRLFAKKNECKYVRAVSANPAAWKVAEQLGFNVEEKHFILSV